MTLLKKITELKRSSDYRRDTVRLSLESLLFLLKLRKMMGEIVILIDLSPDSPIFGTACLEISSAGLTDRWERSYDVSRDVVYELLRYKLVECRSFGRQGMPQYEGWKCESEFNRSGCFLKMLRPGYMFANAILEEVN